MFESDIEEVFNPQELKIGNYDFKLEVMMPEDSINGEAGKLPSLEEIQSANEKENQHFINAKGNNSKNKSKRKSFTDVEISAASNTFEESVDSWSNQQKENIHPNTSTGTCGIKSLTEPNKETMFKKSKLDEKFSDIGLQKQTVEKLKNFDQVLDSQGNVKDEMDRIQWNNDSGNYNFPESEFERQITKKIHKVDQQQAQEAHNHIAINKDNRNLEMNHLEISKGFKSKNSYNDSDYRKFN